MVPNVTKRMRQLTGSLAAMMWRCLRSFSSVSALIAPRSGPQLPVRTSIIAGVAVVHAMSSSASAAGIQEGDQLVSVDGVPAIQVLWEMELEDGVAEPTSRADRFAIAAAKDHGQTSSHDRKAEPSTNPRRTGHS